MKDRLLKRGESSGRVDDNEETIKKRLETFHDVTKPVIDYYEKQNKLKRINSERPPNDVFADIKKILGPGKSDELKGFLLILISFKFNAFKQNKLNFFQKRKIRKGESLEISRGKKEPEKQQGYIRSWRSGQWQRYPVREDG